jgi:hypothetical protein
MSEETILAEVKKSGEMPIIVGLSRHKAGLKLQVKGLPIVEDFFRDFAQGEVQPVVNHARHWYPVSGKPLMVYALPKSLGQMVADDDTRFTLDKVGNPLLIQTHADRPDTSLNLSFLRLVGISEGDGVAFTVKGAMDLEETRRLAQRIMLASRRFFIAYMRPVNINVFVSTQEMR